MPHFIERLAKKLFSLLIHKQTCDNKEKGAPKNLKRTIHESLELLTKTKDALQEVTEIIKEKTNLKGRKILIKNLSAVDIYTRKLEIRLQAIEKLT